MILPTLLHVGWSSIVTKNVSITAFRLLRPPLFVKMAKSDYLTYVWAVENVNVFYRKPIKSPSFKLPSLKSEFCIELCLEDKVEPDLISSKLLRKSGDEFVEVNNMDYELSISATDGSCLIKQEYFSSRDKREDGLYVPRDEVFVQRRSAFLPNNTLTLQWKMSLSQVVYCFARTRLRVEKMLLPCFIDVHSFNSQSFPEAETTFLRSYCVFNEMVWSKHCEEKLRVNLESHFGYDDYDDKSIHRNAFNAIDCYTLTISFSDGLGNKRCILDETRFRFFNSPIITLPLSRKKLMEESNKFLTNGALHLKCLFTFYSDPSMEEIELIKYGNGDQYEHNSSFFNEDKDPSASALKDDLRSLYDNNILCDFTIQTETKVFSVHKSILISRSSVFRSMIMECAKQNLYISDVDSETMHQFLLYLYTDKVEDMEWKKALKLFVVAEQFEVLSLIKKCSLIIKEKLTIRNVCDILLLAYEYHNEDMKSSIQDFISVHDVAIFNSDKWIKMEETNSSIAAETLRISNLKKKKENSVILIR